jgi:restriction endonuclease S subunit
MITYSIIQKSQLEGGLRLDAEFYHPEKLEAMEKLSKFGVSTIAENFRNIKETFNPLRHQLATTPARVFDLSDVSSFLLEEGKEVMESSEVGSTKKIIRQGDVLISRLRPYLKEVSFVGFNSAQKLASTEFVVLRKKKDSKFFPQALFAFLITDEVQRILFWSQGGTEHPRFSENLLMNLKLPKISEKIAESIAEDIDSAYKNYLTSRNLYSQAENFLLEELGLKYFEVEDDLSYIVNLSEIKSAHRADAEYFQPKYEKLISKIKNQNAKLLGEIVSMKKGVEPGAEAYQNEGKLFIRVSSLSKYGIENNDQKYLSEDLYQKLKNNYEPKVGEILLTKDATPGIAYVVKERIEGIISSGILRLKIKDKEIENEYLTLCLNSILGQMQAERDGGGSIITHWKPEQIKSVLIPVLPKSTQQKIADLVQKSHEARSKAKQLLEKARNKVEELIT